MNIKHIALLTIILSGLNLKGAENFDFQNLPEDLQIETIYKNIESAQTLEEASEEAAKYTTTNKQVYQASINALAKWIRENNPDQALWDIVNKKSGSSNLAIKALVKTNEINKVYINKETGYGTTPLIHAIKNNQTLAKKLIELGADPTVKDSDGNTPLMFAAKLGNSEIAKAILEKYPDEINKKDVEGNNALILVILQNNIDELSIDETKKMVELLLKYNALYTLANQKGRTAQELANQEIKQLFKAKN